MTSSANSTLRRGSPCSGSVTTASPRRPSGRPRNSLRPSTLPLTGFVKAGIARSDGGRLRLLSRDELPVNWIPEEDWRRPAWETLLHLVKQHEEGGESAAASLLRRVHEDADAAMELAYWVVDKCQFTQAAEVVAFDGLITSWPRISELAAQPTEAETLPL